MMLYVVFAFLCDIPVTSWSISFFPLQLAATVSFPSSAARRFAAALAKTNVNLVLTSERVPDAFAEVFGWWCFPYFWCCRLVRFAARRVKPPRFQSSSSLSQMIWSGFATLVAFQAWISSRI
jgi:hypothetical protein